MRIYLVRHGEAAPEEVDPERPLTAGGREGIERVARHLKPLGLAVSAIRRSDKLRAAQTAEILGRAVGSADGIVEDAGLRPLEPVEPVQRAVEGHASDLMIVGHLPFLGRLASGLILGDPQREIVLFREGALLCLEGEPRAGWRIAWMVTPESLAGRP